MNKNSALYACGAILLGIVTIYFGDFAMQWQPVPKGIALHQPLVYASGALLVAGGACLLARQWEGPGALLLPTFFAFGVGPFPLPIAFASAGHIGTWNGPAE